MKSRPVTQYSCEFCGKRGLSASHMSQHERGCTRNPNRVCRVCQMDHGEFEQGEAKQAPIADLLALLPDPEEFPIYIQTGTDDYLQAAANQVLPKLRKLSGNCPACIMAALRQKGIPVPMVTGFNFSEEMKDIWNDINNAKAEG